MKLTNVMRTAFLQAAMDDVPQVDYDEQLRAEVKRQADVIRKSAGIAKVDADRLADNYAYIYGQSICEAGLTDVELIAIKNSPAIKYLIDQAEQQCEMLDTLRRGLRGAIYGCRTREQAVKTLPEFEKYLPDSSAPTANLPAVANVVAAFVTAGWPK